MSWSGTRLVGHRRAPGALCALALGGCSLLFEYPEPRPPGPDETTIALCANGADDDEDGDTDCDDASCEGLCPRTPDIACPARWSRREIPGVGLVGCEAPERIQTTDCDREPPEGAVVVLPGGPLPSIPGATLWLPPGEHFMVAAPTLAGGRIVGACHERVVLNDAQELRGVGTLEGLTLRSGVRLRAAQITFLDVRVEAPPGQPAISISEDSALSIERTEVAGPVTVSGAAALAARDSILRGTVGALGGRVSLVETRQHGGVVLDGLTASLEARAWFVDLEASGGQPAGSIVRAARTDAISISSSVLRSDEGVLEVGGDGFFARGSAVRVGGSVLVGRSTSAAPIVSRRASIELTGSLARSEQGGVAAVSGEGGVLTFAQSTLISAAGPGDVVAAHEGARVSVDRGWIEGADRGVLARSDETSRAAARVERTAIVARGEGLRAGGGSDVELDRVVVASASSCGVAVEPRASLVARETEVREAGVGICLGDGVSRPEGLVVVDSGLEVGPDDGVVVVDDAGVPPIDAGPVDGGIATDPVEVATCSRSAPLIDLGAPTYDRFHPDRDVDGVAVSSDERLVACIGRVDDAPMLRVAELGTGVVRDLLPLSAQREIVSIELSPDGAHVVVLVTDEPLLAMEPGGLTGYVVGTGGGAPPVEIQNVAEARFVTSSRAATVGATLLVAHRERRTTSAGWLDARDARPLTGAAYGTARRLVSELPYVSISSGVAAEVPPTGLLAPDLDRLLYLSGNEGAVAVHRVRISDATSTRFVLSPGEDGTFLADGFDGGSVLIAYDDRVERMRVDRPAARQVISAFGPDAPIDRGNFPRRTWTIGDHTYLSAAFGAWRLRAGATIGELLGGAPILTPVGDEQLLVLTSGMSGLGLATIALDGTSSQPVRLSGSLPYWDHRQGAVIARSPRGHAALGSSGWVGVYSALDRSARPLAEVSPLPGSVAIVGDTIAARSHGDCLLHGPVDGTTAPAVRTCEVSLVLPLERRSELLYRTHGSGTLEGTVYRVAAIIP